MSTAMLSTGPNPVPRPSYRDALAAMLVLARPLAAAPRTLAEAIGCRLAEPIVADRDQPPFNRAQMDGYALRNVDLAVGVAIQVVGAVPAGADAASALPPGTCVTIATGAAVPPQADTVIQHELSDRGSPVRFHGTVPVGHAIHPRGSDALRGAIVVDAGQTLTSRHLAAAAAVGTTTPTVTPRPRIALLTSGDEIVAPDATPLPHQIRNSNGALLATLLPAMGAQLGVVTHLPDERELTDRTLAAALRDHDLVVTVGGISAGERDRFVDAITSLRLRTLVQGVALRPGGPLTVAHGESGAPPWLVALPGNPVSALVCAHLFVWPLLRALGGHDPSPPWTTVALTHVARGSAARQPFRPVVLREGPTGGATIPAWSGSGDLIHAVSTAGLVELPSSDIELPAGATVPFLRWADSGS